MKLYEIIILPLSFLTSYHLNSLFSFLRFRKKIACQKFRILQKSSLIWCLLTALLQYLYGYFKLEPEHHTKLLMLSISVAVMPVFILHIPDYLLWYLPSWLLQFRRASKLSENSHELIKVYEDSILFKYEMIYFQLPGLHKFMSFFAKNDELGIEEAVKRISHLHQFTFQQKQAEKAIITLVKDRESAHQYIHLLLEQGNLPLVKTLSKIYRLRELYSILFYSIEDEAQKKKKGWPFSLLQRKKHKDSPTALEERINFVCQEMAKEDGYPFNNEIRMTLEAANKFLTSENLEDFYGAYSILKEINDFPSEIKYLRDIQNLLPQMKRIRDDLSKTESIERFETRRSLLNDQRQRLESLSKTAEETFYEPFATIWKKSLAHFAGVIDKQIKTQQGSANLSIELKNKEMRVSEEEKYLYFEIGNNGQEFASDISVEIEADSPALSFSSDKKAGIQVIESGAVKELSFPITANSPVDTTVRGKIVFSDRTRENKDIPFSFPITIFEEKGEFRKIENPYIAGPALKGKASLYVGRKDAHQFIDRNIMASGDHHTIVCHGLRRTGKSSLLYRIIEHGFSDKRLIPIFFDMQGIDDEADFYFSLSGTIMENLSLETPSEAQSFGEFKRFLRNVKRGLFDKIIVLLIDEFEELQMRVEEGRMSKTIFSNIRHLMQHEEKLIFLFCGTHKLEEMSADYWSIFFNTALYLKINYLSQEDTEKLIRKPVEGQLTYDKLAVEQIFKMTHGQPYLTQLICRTLVNDLNEKKSNNAGINDVDGVVEKIVFQGDHFSTYIWGESTTLERLILSAAAEELTHKQLDRIGFDALYSRIKGVTKKFSKKEYMDTLSKLNAKDILVKQDLTYTFPVNLLRKWIFACHPLREVQEEV